MSTSKFIKRFTKRSRERRTLSSASMESTPIPSKAKDSDAKPRKPSANDRRKRSVSEVLEPTAAVHVPPHLSLLYLGFASIEEPRSTREINMVVKNVNETSPTQKAVFVSHQGGCLTVKESGEDGGRVLACPLYFVGQCTHYLNRGPSDCLGVSFSNGPYAKQCHVFKAKTSKEASEMVQVLTKAYRSASKQVEKKVRKTSESRSSRGGHAPQASSEGGRGKPRVNLMEDEDEVIEHKPISSLSRRESKKSVPLVRTSGEITSSVSSLTGGPPSSARISSSGEPPPPSLINPLSSPFGGPRPLGHTHSIPKESGGKRRGAKRSASSGGTRVSEREFTRQDKVDQLLNAIDKIVENNSQLRERSSKSDPISVFEDALYAMHTSNRDLLHSYLVTRRVEPNLCDASGNSLLHYAVALGQPELVRVLCKNKASLDLPGWNECRPIHRAVAEGNISILQVLLTSGANVNSFDIMRRTPLHIAAGKMELVECAISLMENGAQLMASDVLGLRPHDLNPEFKETQNRLVTSACEAFASTILKDSALSSGVGGILGSSPSATPPSSSSASSRPSSVISGNGGGDHMTSHDPLSDEQLSSLLDKVQLRATILSRAYAQKSKFKKTMSVLSKSFGNLAELKEVDEEELSRELRLKFPSEFRLNSEYYELEENAGVIVKAMNELIRQAKQRKRERGGGGDWLPSATSEPHPHQLELSYSEPDLLNPRSDEVGESHDPRPSSSAAILQDTPSDPVFSKLRADSAASSTGTLVREGEEVLSQRLSAAFDTLEDDLRRGSFHKNDEEGDEVQLKTHKLRPLRQVEPDESVNRTRSETDAIFDELISQMNKATADLGIVPVSSSSATNGLATNGLATNGIADAPVFSPPSNAPDDDDGRGREGEEGDGGTLKKESKSPRIRRINSPFKLRRQTLGTGRRQRKKQRQPSNKEEEEEEEEEEGQDVSHSRKAFKRKMSLPDIKMGPPREARLSGGTSAMELASAVSSSSSSRPPTTSNSASLEALLTKFTAHQQPLAGAGSAGHTHHHQSTLLRRLPEAGLMEPVTNALRVMVTLSSNQECLPTLISYLCLPKCVLRLTSLAQSPHTSLTVLNNIAALMHNVFEGGGTTAGRKNALGSGVLDLTIKLLTSRDPIPGTCLSLLSNLLVSEDDNDYLRTIIRIPSAPLLLYLQPPGESSCHDSGFDTRTVSMGTQSSSDTRQHSTSDESSTGIGMGMETYRASSLTSEASEASSARSLVSPTLKGHLVTHLEARRIVLKMLSVTSSHSKMQRDLCNVQAVYLLSRCLADPSQENVTNATITLANIAQHVGSHNLLTQAGLVDKLRSLLENGPRPRFHATRALVYLGELGLGGVTLFEATGYETDTMFTTDEDDGHTYARGATIEKCVEYLTGDFSRLWGGFSLEVGPHPRATPTTTGHAPSPKATKEQIVDFFFSMYKSFTHPLILMRLLLHRLNDIHDPKNPFDWSNQEPVQAVAHSVSVPPTQMSVLNLFAKWLEAFSDDFADNPQIRAAILKVIERLKLAQGQFIPLTHRLKSLLLDTTRPRTSSLAGEEAARVPHHENLYSLCKQMVAEGHLPVTVEQALFLGALRLHIEEVVERTGTANGVPGKSRRGFTFRLKQALPPGSTKSKSVVKRIRNFMLDFEKLSDRNAKHLFIERCQAMPGYYCSFFSVKVPSNARFKRSSTSKQLLGISKKRIVFLDEKTKELIASHSLHTVVSISREGDPCSLVIDLRGEAPCRVISETTASAREIANVLEQCREGEGLFDEENLRWSDSLPSLFTVSMEQGAGDDGDSPSSPSTNENSFERADTPPGGPILAYDMLGGKGADGVAWQPQTTPSHNATPPNGHLTNTMRMFAGDVSMVTDLTDQMVFPEDMVTFCDCPPDPEIPHETNLHHLSLTDVLRCPLELARQMTLIAHEKLCGISFVELLQKVNMIPKPASSSSSQRSSRTSESLPSLSLSQLERGETAIERLALRFNQVGNWVANSVLQYDDLVERTEVVEQFITIAEHCLKMHNFSTMMAIVVAGLGSAPIRRLQQTWGGVSKQHLELFKTMDGILDSRNNYKLYREKLASMATPAVPYIGVFLKDLTFICEGNPDYLRGGLINLHKRRQVYKKIEEIRHYQKDEFNFHKVPELQKYLLSHRLVSEDELHSMSHQVEPRIRRSHSQNSTSRTSTTQNIFRALTRSGSSSSNLLKTT